MTDPIRGKLADLVESMIDGGLSGRRIWTEVMDHHEHSVAYGSIRHYIRYARRQQEQIVWKSTDIVPSMSNPVELRTTQVMV
ncbi:hypothetical protein [Streptomyces sp. NPDC047999]|uniref:hypothetical protein n=1 Tax=Streptomyces sp. NPDC047999 TaxID=3365497 RepID=UPI00371AD345